jgi:hypothetical protein
MYISAINTNAAWNLDRANDFGTNQEQRAGFLGVIMNASAHMLHSWRHQRENGLTCRFVHPAAGCAHAAPSRWLIMTIGVPGPTVQAICRWPVRKGSRAIVETIVRSAFFARLPALNIHGRLPH